MLQTLLEFYCFIELNCPVISFSSTFDEICNLGRKFVDVYVRSSMYQHSDFDCGLKRPLYLSLQFSLHVSFYPSLRLSIISGLIIDFS